MRIDRKFIKAVQKINELIKEGNKPDNNVISWKIDDIFILSKGLKSGYVLIDENNEAIPIALYKKGIGLTYYTTKENIYIIYSEDSNTIDISNSTHNIEIGIDIEKETIDISSFDTKYDRSIKYDKRNNELVIIL